MRFEVTASFAAVTKIIRYSERAERDDLPVGTMKRQPARWRKVFAALKKAQCLF